MSSGIEQPALRRATDVARTSVFEVRGSSLNSDSRTRVQTLFWRFVVFPTAEPRTPTTGVRATPFYQGPENPYSLSFQGAVGQGRTRNLAIPLFPERDSSLRSE